ncbi:hypothetical protein [Sulfuricella sp.]|uniref:hypothetical protein n=1 Tax=Sulfuricella sp. TaxID=2099377 RepID=UPI002BD19DD4|nr:hypothetical protein [Sulfuricella sp.]HUX63254.1 hypothetical protein [Sulfuricella sp.]
MITLNSDKGLVKIESWEDIEQLPGFVTDMNPSDHKLEAIIGRYAFKDKIKCGLSNCRTLHGKGYIAKTEDGRSTNIGKDCGKNYFGVEFETLSKKFERDVTESENRDRLWSFSFQLDELEQKLDNFRCQKRGADWVYKKSRPLVSLGSGCPEEIVHRISAMVKARTTTLNLQRPATETEIETLEAMQGRKVQRPHAIDEPIANIAGLQVLYPENDLKELLVNDLVINIKSFKSNDIDSLTFEELRYWTKWVSSIENTMEKAANAVVLGNSLLSQSNLDPLARLLSKREDLSLFRSFLKSLTT